MKNIKNYIVGCLVLTFMTGCYEGIDEIQAVDPGEDLAGPVIDIMRPVDGLEIQVPEPTTSVNIEFKAVDDIEIDNVSVLFDGTQIAFFDDFIDYRTANEQMTYDNVTTGEHTITVVATDLSGKTTSKTHTFTKAPPYTPVYAGETFYMPFDGDYTELNTVRAATEVGSPGFSDDSYVGSRSYKGASQSYLTFPTDGLLGDEFSATFWYKVNNDPDRAGILVIGPPDETNPDAQNNRTSGFRLFRENAGGMQRIKLNIGNGTGDNWFDGGAAADIDPASDEWVHIAFTISQSQAAVYINGNVVRQGEFAGVDWSGCDVLSIMSGAPRFSGWNHLSDLSLMDELRLFDRELTQSDIISMAAQGNQTLYMPFNNNYKDVVSTMDATEVGNPGFAGEAYAGSNAYEGATDSYLTFPTDGLLGEEFTAAFWYKVNSDPGRAGILVVGPTDEDNPDAQNKRSNGFRFFREAAGGMQRFKLNIGNGTGDNWFDGGAAADVDPTVDEWVHLAFTISGSRAAVYINGEIVREGDFGGVDWTDCDILSIMSGAPRFTGWNHLSDLSIMDELRLFNKALSQTEIQAMID